MVMLSKQMISEALANLPDEISLEALIDRFIVLEKIEAARRQIENGESIADEDLDKEIEKWFE